MRLIILISLNVLFLCVSFLQAQVDDSLTIGKQVEIILDSRDIYFGVVQVLDSNVVTIQTEQELEITIPRKHIKSIAVLQDETKGSYRYVDPNDSRLFFGPTARTLDAGQSYFADYYIFFPFLGYGLTDYLTFAGGISLFPGAKEQLFYLAPKIRFYRYNNWHTGMGVLYINSTSMGSDGVGIVYGVSTFGASDESVTLGAGWGFAEGELHNKPVIMFGGELRVSNNLKLISENWIPPDADFALLSLGLRFFGKNLATDIALIYPAGADMEGFPFVPWIDFVYNFNK